MALKKVTLKKDWVICPKCGAKCCIKNDISQCSGVYLKCTRGCKGVFELVIVDGHQVINK